MNKPVTFEIAKLLKEKGFGLSDDDYIQLPRFYEENADYVEYAVHVGKKYNPSHNHLGADTIEDFKAHLTMIDNSLDSIYLAPTIAEVVMWLYEKHGIWIDVRYMDDILLLKIILNNMGFINLIILNKHIVQLLIIYF